MAWALHCADTQEEQTASKPAQATPLKGIAMLKPEVIRNLIDPPECIARFKEDMWEFYHDNTSEQLRALLELIEEMKEVLRAWDLMYNDKESIPLEARLPCYTATMRAIARAELVGGVE